MKYLLKCLGTGDLIEDAYTLKYTDNALLQAKFNGPMEVKPLEGVWKYLDWIPTSTSNEYVAGTTTYKAEALGKSLGMSNLWVTFHGYWPEKGGMCPTGSFKDMEAVPTIQRLHDHGCKGLICASAGNTARGFTHFCGLAGMPLIVVVGKDHGHRIWTKVGHPTDSVKVVVVEDGDYYDAKTVAKAIAKKLTGWQMEGSVHNVARRDGIGSLILDAAFTIGAMPEHYFQGIGGGPGPIGVHEMAERLIESGQFEGPAPRQHLSQNVEHSPIHNAWQAKRDHLVPEDYPPQDVEVYSDYLMNKGPAYGQVGGVHDILKASNGQTYVVERDDAVAAKTQFESIEGIDIMTPGAVAMASLQQALASGEVDPDACTVLNISGGGVERLKQEHATETVEPWLRVTKADGAAMIIEALEQA
ncbi:MAG: cysteate synthase [Candidatus Poseidoniaceae archaeon]|nr:cysteate synthase [Candidatus Poseidoniaceae archaeon]